MNFKKFGAKKFRGASGRIVPRRNALLGGNSALGSYRHRQYFWQRRSFKLWLILIAVAIVILLYLLFGRVIFTIKTISVQGLKTLSTQEIEQIVNSQEAKRRWLVFSQQNLWVFDSKMAENSLRERFMLDSVKIKKRPLGKLKIELSEKSNQLTWVSGEDYYYLDPNGLAVKDILVANIEVVEGDNDNQANAAALIDSEAIDQNLPKVIDDSVRPLEVGQQVLTASTVSFINALDNQLKQLDLTVTSYSMANSSATEIIAKTNKGFDIYFNTSNDLERQIANLKLVLKEKVGDSRVEYIDLRFGNKVYIK